MGVRLIHSGRSRERKIVTITAGSVAAPAGGARRGAPGRAVRYGLAAVTARRARIPIVDLSAEWAEVGPDVEAAVLGVLRSGRYVRGPATERFEADLARLVRTRFAIGVGSGTEALALALRACGVGPGDEVVTTPFTFFATVEAILLAGARPVFADLEPGGFHVDARAVERALGPKTRAIVPVHLFGRCADVARLRTLADACGAALVEDAAQAIGAARGGRPAGAWGDAGSFSFYPSKILGAAGDAGCVTTSRTDVAERVRLLGTHGLVDGRHTLAGTTSRLDSIQAAVLTAKLPYLKAWTDRRASVAERYRRALGDLAHLHLPASEPDETPVWTHFALRSPRAPGIRRALDAADVEWRHYYPRPVYREPALAPLAAPACPEAERACEEVVVLPVHPSLAPDSIDRICGAVREALGA